MNAAAVISRWRVRAGYVLAIVVLWFARPTPWSIALGAVIGLAGLAVRGYAAGHLHKQDVLTVGGPYAHTRNPLYLGSAILALGVAVATRSWISAAVLGAYFAVVYSVVMRREEEELRGHHGAAFEEYSRTVPLFLPRIAAARTPRANAGAFSLQQYRKNHEHQAAIGYLLLLDVLLILWRWPLH